MADTTTQASAPIILVPGWWLGAWAWDEVAARLRADGHEVTALTLPGLESADADRSEVTLADHANAIADAVRTAGTPAVLAVHSGAGFPGYAATDQVADRLAAMVYVDTAPGIGAADPEFAGADKPLPPLEQLAEEENLDGIPAEKLQEFARRAVPEPGGVIRTGVELMNDARRDVPTTIICTAFPSEDFRAYAAEHDPSWMGGIKELRDITWLDLPTSHWPMWSRPQELAAIIGDIARANAPTR